MLGPFLVPLFFGNSPVVDTGSISRLDMEFSMGTVFVMSPTRLLM